jgi:ribonuclease III
MPAEPASLEIRLNHRFSDPELLRRALTHSSLAYERHSASGAPLDDNEPLEFLGDAVLGFLVSEALVRRHPEHREGELSVQKAYLVSAAHLHGVARRLEIGAHLELGRGEEITGGRAKKNLLVDALEAVIAALYLDGGIDVAREFVTTHILDAVFAGDEESGTDIQLPITNFKKALLELSRSRKAPEPHYGVVRVQGPEHAKTFTIEVRIGKDWSAQAEGRTKKAAAQRAARGLYERLLDAASAPGGEQAVEPAAPPSD